MIVEFITRQSVIQQLFQMGINTLFIDFDDTIVSYKNCQDKALDRLLLAHNLEKSDYPEIYVEYHRINDSLWPNLEKGTQTIPEIRRERFEILKTIIPFDADPVDLDNEYLTYFIESTEISENNFSSLKHLRELGFKITITTNGIRDVQHQRIKKIEIDSLIDRVITSEDVGKAKPEPLMYERSMELDGISNDQAFIIGDSLSSDIKGANNAGIRSCWLSYNRKFDINRALSVPDIIANDFSTISSFIINLKSI